MTHPTEPSHGLARRGWLRRRTAPFILIAVIFLSGFVVGGATMPLIMFHYRQDFFPPPSEMPRRLTEDMRQDLALTEAQARAVRAAFENHQEELAVFHEEVQSRMTGIMDGLRDEIAAILTPEQAERWTARFDDMRERKMPFGPPPPWGGPGGPEGRERLGGR